MDVIGDYRVLHPKAAEYSFASRPHGTFSRTDHMLGCKVNLGKFKKTEIPSNIFSDHNAMRSEINHTHTHTHTHTKKKNPAKNTNTGKLNNLLLNSQWIIEEIKEEIKNT